MLEAANDCACPAGADRALRANGIVFDPLPATASFWHEVVGCLPIDQARSALAARDDSRACRKRRRRRCCRLEHRRTLVAPSAAGTLGAFQNEPSIGRGSRIRTCGPLLPKQVLYQAELCPDTLILQNNWRCRVFILKLVQGLHSENRPLSVLFPQSSQPRLDASGLLSFAELLCA